MRYASLVKNANVRKKEKTKERTGAVQNLGVQKERKVRGEKIEG
jgi:hypothetical protein